MINVDIKEIMSEISLPSWSNPVKPKGNHMPDTDEMLWKAVRRFRALIESSNEVILVLSVDGICRYLSPSAERLLGYKSEQMIAKNILEFIHDDDILTVTEAIKDGTWQNNHKIPEFEYRIRHADGSWRTFVGTLTNLLEESTVEGLVINCHDITDRKQAEEELRQSEQRFRRLVSSISDHIYVTELTPDGRYINRYISPNVVELTGYPLEKFMADRNFWPSTVIHPDDRIAAAVQSNTLDVDQNCEMQYRLVRADKQIVWVRDSAKVYREGDSKVIYGVVSNITERKNLEDQYRHAQKMEAVGQLASGVAHEFNNMLTVLIGQSELIYDMLKEDDPLRADVERIRKISDRAAALTRQLLTFSRKQVTRPEILNLNNVISNIDKMLRQIIGDDIELVTLLETQLGQINADPGQIEQIILNLVVNASDAMPYGGTLTIETANVDLDELYTQQRVDLKPGRYVMLAISDTGHGIPEQVKPRIFEPFFTTKESGKGTGLGLATVHGIVKQNGGHIWVYSEPEQITTFKVYLPQVDQTTPWLDQDQSSNTVTQPGTETVLLVDDEDALRELVGRILIRNGYRVLEARNGPEALKKYGQYTEPIALLLTDVTMPGGVNGLELARQLRMHQPKLEVIYMSGRTDRIAVHQAELDQSAVFLQKPFSLKTLTQKVREVLDS